MSTSSITSATSAAAALAANDTSVLDSLAGSSAEVLSQGDFLKLLVAQMTSQNPLDPLDNQDLLTQMVQFSTLQQNTGVQKALTALHNSEGLVQANSLLGRQVTLQVDAETLTQGTVTAVLMDTGTPQIVVDGNAYNLDQVLMITSPPVDPS